MIDTEKDNRKLVERALLIGIQDDTVSLMEAKEHLSELKDLVQNLSVPVIGEMMINLREPHAKYYLGIGKANEVKEFVVSHEADCIVFDCNLSPAQQRNWEKFTGVCVIERQEVILDIFASRASTREAVLQVNLARMQYTLPRLTRAWTHLSRQKGGAKGTRGEGEQQIEVDRRIVQQKISQLKKELKKVRKHRQVQRKSRKRHEIPQAAIVGYTNAGKSSLLNVLTDSEVFVEDKLFATLDPTTKKIILPNNQPLLLTDTVGFIRKLPHNLVESFKATLEEAVLADFIIHVIDITSHQIEEHFETTLKVFDEIGASTKNMINVFNKIDLLEKRTTKIRLKNLYPDSVFISTRTGFGMDELKSCFIKHLSTENEILNLRIPPAYHAVAALAYEKGNVLSSEYDNYGNLDINLSVNKAHRKLFSNYLTET